MVCEANWALKCADGRLYFETRKEATKAQEDYGGEIIDLRKEEGSLH